MKYKLKDKETKSGMLDSIPIVLGYLSITITFGIMAKNSGLSFFETMFMSIIVYGGSSQFMILNLLAIGAGIGEIIFTSFLINFRYFLIGTSFLNMFKEDLGKLRLLMGHTLTDETFSVASFRKKKLTANYMLGINITPYLSWIIGTFLGFIFGGILPEILRESMGIALYAMFIAILIPQIKYSKDVTIIILITMITNTVLTYTKILPEGWNIIFSIIVPAIIGVIIKRNKMKRGDVA